MSTTSPKDPVCISDIEQVNDEQYIGLLEAVESFSEIYEHDLELLLEAFEASQLESTHYFILDCCVCYQLVINNIREGLNASKRRINRLLVDNLIQSWIQFCSRLETETEES